MSADYAPSAAVQTSIIVVTFNNRLDIDVCLRSLQAHSHDAEIIVVDNLSTDGTLDHVREHYPVVHAVSAGSNGGFGAGVNLGAQMATGDYVAVVNPDTEVQPGWLEPLVTALDQPGVGLVTPTILLMGSDDLVNACGNSIHITGLTFCAGLKMPAPPSDGPSRPVAAISGAAFMLRRSLWERIGGFDEHFFMYLEDTDLSLRIRRLGFTILHVPASRIWHRYTVRVSAAKLYHLELNRLRMLHKNLSPTTLAILSPALILTEAVTWAFCARQGISYLGAKWQSYRQFWHERHELKMRLEGRSRKGHADRSILSGCTAQLAMEQLEDNVALSYANRALTAYYAFWRGLALVTTAR